MPRCMKCGKEVPTDSSFCTDCGTPITSVSQDTYQFEIKYQPSYSMLVLSLKQGQMIVAEAGSMTYMTPNIEVRTRRREKSILGTLGMKILGGQSLFVNEYWANQGEGEIALVSAPVGDITKIDIQEEGGYIIQKSAYIASSPTLDLDIQWQGFTKGIFGQGLFMIKVSGRGELFINCFGAIDKHILKQGETIIVDNFHLVGFSDTCQYEVQKFGGWKETLLSGEGLVTRITGPGEVLVQTKNLREFVEWLWVLLQPRVRSTAR
ncbi:TIGR00266 family protein [[Eubacterium] cellulosolvens]